MTREVDARGLPCPQPVVNARKALQEIDEGTINVLVDRPDARENVERFARSQGCGVTVREEDGVYHLEIAKQGPRSAEPTTEGQVVLIGSDRLGAGDDALGDRLMKSFLKTIDDGGFRPAKLLFVNSGVRLTTEGSEVLDVLEELERKGVQILSCGTCLEHYDLVEQLRVGLVTNMYDIVDSMLAADKAIRI
jgi:selenium metabolism protein YedF